MLIACGKLVGQDVSEEQAQAAAEKHRFDKYEKTGDLEFRRFGRAGSWQVSGNFTDEIAALAERILGPLRTRLGYDAEAATAPSDAQRAETLTSPAD